MDRHIGAKIAAVWGFEELELAAEAQDLPEWWDFQTHALLCNTSYGFVVLYVPEVQTVEQFTEWEWKARIHGCDSSSSADSYWCQLPVLVIEREWK
jgi:hypothetical protein